MAHSAAQIQATENGSGFEFDPRLRIVVVSLFAVLTVSLTQTLALGGALTLSLVTMVLCRAPFGQTLRRMATMDGFILIMLIMLPFTMPGDPFVTVAGYDASWQGLWRAVEIALTANAIVLMVLSLLGTMEAVTLGHALHKLKVPVALIHLLLFTVRYIQVLREEYTRMRQAMKARGFRPNNSMHTWRSFGYLIGMMLVRAVERSERILDAMKCRGFAGQFPLLMEFRLKPSDWLTSMLFTLAMCGLYALEVYHVTAS